jgi:hypothetical protein
MSHFEPWQRESAEITPLDLICVPGGLRVVIQAMTDRDLIEFVRRQAGTAKYVM